MSGGDESARAEVSVAGDAVVDGFTGRGAYDSHAVDASAATIAIVTRWDRLADIVAVEASVEPTPIDATSADGESEVALLFRAFVTQREPSATRAWP